MENLVIQEGRQALTTSLKVAETFGKEHRHVLRDIKELCEQLENITNGGEPKFGLTSYTSVQGKELPMYVMDRNAFTLLVMGYTGAKALRFKIDYIKAFDAMEAHIRESKGKTLTTSEGAMIHQMLNFYRFLNNCKKAEEDHKKRFIASNAKEGTKEEIGSLAQQFHKMRNTLLEIGSAKELEARYKRYCLQNPEALYNGNASKFVMLLTMDKYEVVCGAIFDFLKMEWQTDNYSVELSKQAKDMAEKANLKVLRQNETNLFDEKEEDLIDMSKLHYLASQLLAVNM
jgi:Rha family phage regulatory protein